jgi:hypothetical protein
LEKAASKPGPNPRGFGQPVGRPAQLASLDLIAISLPELGVREGGSCGWAELVLSLYLFKLNQISLLLLCITNVYGTCFIWSMNTMAKLALGSLLSNENLEY